MVVPKKKTILAGFGMIELIVSISIVVIATGIVVARHNVFNSAVLLRSQAYEIAFIINEAQQLAVSGAQTSNLSAVSKQRYGVAFSRATGGSVNRQTVVLYKDNNDNARFDSGDNTIKTYRLDSRFEIASLSLSNSSASDMRVLFERPLFDAVFYRDNINPIQSGPARIVVRPVASSNPDSERVISVSSAGQVNVLESN